MGKLKYFFSKICDIIVGCGLGFLFFHLSFGWPDEDNKFFDQNEFYILPTLFGTVGLFIFGMISSTDTRSRVR